MARYRSRRRNKRKARRYNTSKQMIKVGGNNADKVEMPFLIERKDKEAPKEVNGVPLVIYRSWMTHNIKKRMNDVIMKDIEQAKEFDNYLYSDKECLEFIEKHFEPNVANAFKCLKPGAYKSDLWRYCILYINGGVYSDIKLEFHMPLKDILEEQPKIFIIDYDTDKGPLSIWNGFIASPPGNPVFRSCIDEIIVNCKNKDYKESAKYGYLEITGPGLLGKMLEMHEGKEFVHNLRFKHNEKRQTLYDDGVFLTEYDGYRHNMSNQETVPHYGKLWTNKDVFDDAIKFE